MANVVRGACPHDCPDTCAWLATVEDGVVTKLVGDPDHPFTRGGLCAKVNRFLDRVYGPQRLLHPLRRIGPKGSGDFERVSWDEALDDIASRLQSIVAESGSEAVLPYSYLGTQGLVQHCSMDRRFFARLGASRLTRSICGATGSVGVYHTLGTSDALMPEEIVHARFIILWGTNTIMTNLHLWPLVREAKAQGATVVVIDPARTRTAQSADWHVAPLPGTDAALALGMMHVIVAGGLHDADYIDRYTVGFEQLRTRLEDYPPERVAEITGLDAEEIVKLARAYATTRPALIRTLVGMEHREHGGMAFRTIACLPALVGAWRERGGGLLHMTANMANQALDTNALEMPWLEDSSLREFNMVQLGRALTDPTLDPPVRALVVYNSNPAATAPEQGKVLAGLRRDDLFTVVLEHVMTDTARHADYVLPATTQLEHWDLNWSWGQAYLALNQPAIPPVGEALPNSEIFRRLAAKMGYDEPYFAETDEEMIRTALATGHPLLGGATFDDLRERGWIRFATPDDQRPFAEGSFPTPSGKCEFYSEKLARRGYDPLPGWTPPNERANGGPFPLSLLAAKTSLHFLNSSYSGIEHHRTAEREPLLDIHQFDAGPRDIADGTRVRVFNGRGAVEATARVGERVRPGVVLLPYGWWASQFAGGEGANALTNADLSDWGGGGAFHDSTVEVARVE